MKQLKNFALILSILAMLPNAYASDIWEDTSNVDDRINAKVMRYLARQRALEANMTDEEIEERNAQLENKGGCGTIDIGNVRGSKSDDIETVVIVRGDIVNAGRCN